MLNSISKYFTKNGENLTVLMNQHSKSDKLFIGSSIGG
ncbi:hypothetical protein LX73_2039 [Fodinibius salinus]|uniref:Uncharacterized protein n=1 Tax=Fodinibius salinus TaxID=860790 RepID=A0A5D3YHC1_9BACT|nr:hypothetical protein LX73_2039 [Fodinibius salinus]